MLINQETIDNNLKKYVALLASEDQRKYNKIDVDDLLALTGECNGHSGLYLYRKKRGEESQLFGFGTVIAQWDGTKESLEKNDGYLKHVFEQYFSNLLFIQQPLIAQLNQDEIDKSLQIVQIGEPLKKEFSMAFVFQKNKKELEKTLAQIVNPGKLISISTPTHAIAVTLMGKYCAYDPNTFYDPESPDPAMRVPEQEFSTIEELTEAIEEYLYTNFGEVAQDMAIDIHVFDTQESEPFPYVKTAAQIAEDFLKKRENINLVSTDGYTVLQTASRFGNLPIVELCLQQSAKIDSASGNRDRTALMEAICEGRLEVSKFLLQQGASVELVDNTGLNALMIAASQGWVNIARELLQKKQTIAVIEEKDHSGFSALQYAAGQGHVEIVRELIQYYPANSRTQALEEALRQACIDGTPDSVKILLGMLGPFWLLQEDTAEELLKNLDLAFERNYSTIFGLLVRQGAELSPEKIRTYLLEASLTGKLYILKHLLDLAPKQITAQGDQQVTLLMKAANMGHDDIILELIKRGAQPDAPNELNQTALMFAADNKHPNCVAALLQSGADPNIKSTGGHTAFYFALNHKDFTSIDLLLAYGLKLTEANRKALIDKFSKVESANPPLVNAVVEGHVNIVKLLLDDKNINAKQKAQLLKTALVIAAAKGNTAIVEHFIHAGVDLTSAEASAALQQAIIHNHLTVVQKLLKPNKIDLNRGQPTPLMHAVDHENPEIMTTLLESGAKMDTPVPGWPKVTAVDYAVKTHSSVAIKLFIEKDPHLIQYTDAEGKPLINKLAASEQWSLVRLLLRKGANIDPIDPKGMSPLHFAVKTNNVFNVKFLLDNKANINRVNKQGETPFMLSQDKPKLFELLLHDPNLNLSKNGPNRSMRQDPRVIKFVQDKQLQVQRKKTKPPALQVEITEGGEFAPQTPLRSPLSNIMKNFNQDNQGKKEVQEKRQVTAKNPRESKARHHAPLKPPLTKVFPEAGKKPQAKPQSKAAKPLGSAKKAAPPPKKKI